MNNKHFLLPTNNLLIMLSVLYLLLFDSLSLSHYLPLLLLFLFNKDLFTDRLENNQEIKGKISLFLKYTDIYIVISFSFELAYTQL